MSVCLSFCLSFFTDFLYVFLSIYLSVLLSVCLSFCMFLCLSVCLSLCMSYLSIYLFINLYKYLSIFQSSPADLLLSPEMLHASPHPTAAPLHINSCSSAPLLHPSPSSEPVFSSPGGPLSCLTAAAAANSLPLSLDLQQQPLV